jgi:hypothetical protein
MSWFWQGLLLAIFVVPFIVLFGYATWDIIRRHDARLVVRALWLIGFCVLPIIGPLIYLVIRPPGTTADQRRVAHGEAATMTTAAELGALADLHDRGKLTDREFEVAKSKHVGADVSEVTSGSVREQRGSQML